METRAHKRGRSADDEPVSPSQLSKRATSRVSSKTVSPNQSHTDGLHARTGNAKSRAPHGDGGDDSDADADYDKFSNEALETRLRNVTDEQEVKRLKRLLRNRVSAQQARERKKQYLSQLEKSLAEKEAECSNLQREVSKVNKQNAALRRVVMTMRGDKQAVQPPQHDNMAFITHKKHQQHSQLNASVDDLDELVVPETRYPHSSPSH